VGAIGDVLLAAGWPIGLINRDGLNWLQNKLIQAQSVDRLRLAGMKDDRRAIIGGGLSLMRAVFDLLQIDEMQMATGGLRHGLVFDLMGSEENQTDVRTKSVERLATKFGTETAHGLRVGQVAKHLFEQLQPPAQDQALKTADLQDRVSRKLFWAAQLHEIGSQISHSDYQKHGAYILDNSDALGFSLPELHKLSLLVLGHRGKLKKLDIDFEDSTFTQQLMALRIAVALCHARRDPDLSGVVLGHQTEGFSGYVLDYKSSWAQAFPQSAHLLREEVLAWEKTPCSLVLRETR
jgi:exopolyphosphatase/guanosine-5'-triphosphate,3'-diphosphate pyrophosphatase